MTDNTPFSVRMEQEDKNKLIQMIQDSGKSNKEFMTTLLSAYELNKAKIEIPDIAKDIEGLQAVTNRINEYYVNIGKRIEDVQKVKDLEFTKELSIYKRRIEGLEADKEKLTGEYTGLQQTYNNLSKDYKKLKKEVEEFEDRLKDKNVIIDNLKDEKYSVEVSLKEHKKYKEDIEEYKKLLAAAQAKNIDLENDSKEKDSIIEKLNNEVAALKQDKEEIVHKLNTKHEEEIEAVKKEAEFQKKTEILELKQGHQDHIEELQAKYINEIQEYQKESKELLQQLRKPTAQQNKKTVGNTGHKEGTLKGAK